ncbi:TonB-dependent receptor [Niastella caeni]|uniref:TonB-dependent receptor n=1 Tax=Niastella caeni TaxID=2569763 RepID=A0A4S8HTR3_9BACT|nr:outer membrane beta-barrel protein [Niastella caeni]THU38019.1 TonB-dependent receptor [Niastella caeni]
MKPVLALLLAKIITLSVCAQIENSPRNKPAAAGTGKLIGRIVDAKTNKGIEAASVQLFQKNSDILAGGMLTKPNGDFDIINLSITDTFKLEATAIGYAKQEVIITFDKSGKGSGFTVEKDLGNIKLNAESHYLNSVTVVGQKPALQMGIDRKTFDVEKNLASAGGTGIDVMRNIPSVTVDVDGNVLLRNNAPQIFVDGRPTILTLDQIPADNIERVELITNPSAKFDAASTGGIINVVLKKNKKIGLNGLVSAGAGSPNIYNGNLALNLRQGKFNFFVNGNYNQSGGRPKTETYRQNKDNGIVTDYFNQFAFTDRNRRFAGVRFGMDFFLDNRNTFTLTQNFGGGRFTNNEEQHQEYLNLHQQPDHYGYRTSDSRSTNGRTSTQFVFKHNFVESGKSISADINYNYGRNSDNTNILNTYSFPDGSMYAPESRVRNNGSGKNNQITVQVDYVDPQGEDNKLETGVRSYINDFTSFFNAFFVNNSSEIKLPLSNNYQYREMVNAAYVTYTGKLLGIGYQAGLRAEHSKFDGELVDSAKKFGYQFPGNIGSLFDALFPSLYLSKNIGEGQEIQLNYSRRIRRPDFWQMNPFVDINDPLNIRQGNPALRPEFTNSFEFNYNKIYNSGSFLGVIYFRNTQGDITRYSDTITAAQYQQLNNAAIDPSAILNTFVNARYQNRLGAELTLQQKVGQHLDITPTVDMQYKKVESKVNNTDLSNEGFNWEAKLIINYRFASKAAFWNKWSFQVTGGYESPEVIPQGERKEMYAVDFGLRKEFFKNKATFTFNINDVFNSRRRGIINDTENFYQDAYRRWDVRSFRATLAYKFGKTDFQLFKRSSGHEDHEERD